MEWYDPLQEKKGGATKVKVPEIGKSLPLPYPMYRTVTVTYVPYHYRTITFVLYGTDTVTYVPYLPYRYRYLCTGTINHIPVPLPKSQIPLI
jgi:hypothetical protein